MNIALIGCGGIAKSHLRIIKKIMPTASISLCDIDRDQAEQLSTGLNSSSIFTSLDDLLSKAKPDIVHILTPVWTHVSLAKKALCAGCHVYIEKPVTESAAEYNDLSELAKKEGRIMCTGYSTLGMPVVLKARNAIDSGKLGRLLAVHCDFMCGLPNNKIPYIGPDHWAYSMTGGVLQNMADHPASLVVDAMDGVQEHKLFSCSRNLMPNDCPDLLHVAMRNKDQIGSFTLSLGYGTAHRQAQYYLEKGTIIVDMGRQLICIVRGSGPQNFIKKTLSGIAMGRSFAAGAITNVLKVVKGNLQRDPGIAGLIANFYNAVQKEEELIVSHKTGIQTVALLEDIWKTINMREKL